MKANLWAFGAECSVSNADLGIPAQWCICLRGENTSGKLRYNFSYDTASATSILFDIFVIRREVNFYNCCVVDMEHISVVC